MNAPGLSASRLVAIGMGANLGAPGLGPPAATLAWAASRLGELLTGARLASLYRTAPISHLEQPDFYNTVALADLPELSPRSLLGQLKALEREAGRAAPAERNAPRVLDLDLLFFGDLVLDEKSGAEGGTPSDWVLPPFRPRRGGQGGEVLSSELWRGPLTLPHPRLRERLFVLAPLRDLAPDLALPPDGRQVAELYDAIAGSQRIERLL